MRARSTEPSAEPQLATSVGALEWIALSRAVDALFEGELGENNFARVLRLLLDRVTSPRGALGYLDEFGELVLRYRVGMDPGPDAEHAALGLDEAEWEGAWGKALREREVCVDNGRGPDARLPHLRGARELAAPIRFGGRLIGVLYAADKASDYDTSDQGRIALIADRVAPALSYELAQRRFQRQLREAEEMAAAAAEGERFFMLSRDLMAIADTHVRRANPAFSSLLGWEPSELRDKSIADLTHPNDRELLERGFTAMRTEPNREHTPLSVQMLAKTGETRRIEWVGAATEEGRVYAVGRDVSALTLAIERLAVQNEELQRLDAEARSEQQLAGRLLAHVRRQGCLDTEGIQYVASSLGFFNGDVALAALTPSGELRLLLGDFTGHGLSAAIGTVPLAGAFYTTCQQDLPLAEAIASINDLLESLLPPGLFCAAGFLNLNPAQDTLSIWNSGLPPIFVRGARARTLQRYPSRALPLGLVSSRELGIEPLCVPVEAGDDVFVFSDGLTEATNAHGELFGVERVEHALAGSERCGQGFGAIVKAVSEFRGGVLASDDLSLVSVSVGHVRTSARAFARKTPLISRS